MIETEILLDLAGDLSQHVDRIVAGDGGPGNVVEEGELPGTALLLGEEARILHGDGDLASGSYQHVKIALFEDKFAVGVHRDHNPRRLVAHLVAQKDGRGDQAFRGALRNVRYAQALTRVFQIGADQQRFARADHVLSESVPQFSSALGQDATISNLKFEANLVAFLERNVEVVGIEDLPQFHLDGAKDLVLVEPGTDRLSDLGQQFVFFCPAMGIVTEYIVFERQAQLQSQTHHEPRAG